MLVYGNLQDSFTNANEEKPLCECRTLQQSNSMAIRHKFCSFVVLCAELTSFMDSFQFFSLSTVFRNLRVSLRERGGIFSSCLQ